MVSKEVENVRIANRLFLWFALLTMFVALSVFSCLYFTVRPSLQRTAYGALEGIAQSDLRAVDQAIASANAVSVNTTYSTGIREAMAKLNHRGVLTHTELTQVAEQLVAVNGTMFPVIQIRLYPESGLMLASGMINGQYVFSRGSLPWYAEVMAADGSKVISAPFRDESLSKRGYVIALRRAFKQNFRQSFGVVFHELQVGRAVAGPGIAYAVHHHQGPADLAGEDPGGFLFRGKSDDNGAHAVPPRAVDDLLHRPH